MPSPHHPALKSLCSTASLSLTTGAIPGRGGDGEGNVRPPFTLTVPAVPGPPFSQAACQSPSLAHGLGMW